MSTALVDLGGGHVLAQFRCARRLVPRMLRSWGNPAEPLGTKVHVTPLGPPGVACAPG